MLGASAHDRDAGGLHADVQHNHGRYFIMECIKSLALLFVTSVTLNLVSENLVWVNIINSMSFQSQMIRTSEEQWAFVRVMPSLCEWRLSLWEVQNEWDSQWIVLRCVWDSFNIEESEYLPTQWLLRLIYPWNYMQRIQIRNGSFVLLSTFYF